VRTLQNAIASGRLGQAYLFSGLRGVGKTTAARLLAKAVNCAEGPTPEPCGTCVSCREITDGVSLDVTEIDAATRTGVDEIRDLQEVVRYRPTRDRYRVIIVDEVHMLSASAFNALLKSIEEPPEYLLWIFATTERHKVPATVLSRCQELEFRPVSSALIADRLLEIAREEGFELAPEAAAMIARASGGSVRDALSLTDQLRAFSGDAIGPDAVAEVLGVPRRERVLALVSSIVEGDAGTLLSALREELREGHDPTVLWEALGRELRTLTLAVAGADPSPELDGEAEALSGCLSLDAWTRILGLWLDHEPVVRTAAHRDLALEVAALRLSRWPTVRRVEALLSETGGNGGRGTGGDAPRQPDPTRSRGGSGGRAARPAKPTGPAEALADALWNEGLRQAAGAAGEATVEIAGGRAVLGLPAERAPLARILEQHLDTIRGVASRLWNVTEVDVTVGNSGPAEDPLAGEVARDPGVAIALEVLGGSIAAVKPDGNGEASGWS